MGGSWNGWSREQEMEDNNECFLFYVELGSEGKESFQITVDPGGVLFPSVEDATPYAEHAIIGPARIPKRGFNWTIGSHPKDSGAEGEKYEIKLVVDGSGNYKKVEWRKLPSREVPKPRY